MVNALAKLEPEEALEPSNPDMMRQLVSQWAQWDNSLRILGDKNVKNYRMGPPVEFAFSWLRKVTEFYGLW